MLNKKNISKLFHCRGYSLLHYLLIVQCLKAIVSMFSLYTPGNLLLGRFDLVGFDLLESFAHSHAKQQHNNRLTATSPAPASQWREKYDASLLTI